ncbi:hypothetical protein FORC54_0110 [Vibrio vulnificus]|nr:hypothetical protein FORC54_0110 [Vibrio vulnificus]
MARTESDGAKSNEFCRALPVTCEDLTQYSQKRRQNVLLITNMNAGHSATLPQG